MDSDKLAQKKQQMVESARAAVEDIQAIGKQNRTTIQTFKNAALYEIERCSQQAECQQTIHAEQRSRLLQQLSEAARSGDLAEMQRLKAMLAE